MSGRRAEVVRPPEEDRLDVRITDRNADLDEEAKDLTRQKFDGLERYLKGTRSVECVFDKTNLDYHVEVMAHIARGAPVVVNATATEWRTALEQAHDRLVKVLRRLKKKREGRRRGGRVADLAGDGGPTPSDEG